MPAYVISQVTPLDEDAFSAYRDRAAASIAKYGGKYVVRGGELQILEGDFERQAIVVVEFPDLDTARRWYRSSEYALALNLRDKALARELVLVNGVSLAD